MTAGDNTTTFPDQHFPGYQAGPRWDAATGLGTPNAAQLVPMLITSGS